MTGDGGYGGDMSRELRDFVLARILDAEAAARRMSEPGLWLGLAATHRRVLKFAASLDPDRGRQLLRILAARDVDHPEHRPEWRL